MIDKYAVLTELIKLARTDENVVEEEYNFIVQLAWFLGVSRTEVDGLFEQYIEDKPSPFETDRILQFHRLVLLANVDFEVDKKELEFLKDAGLRLGLNPLAVLQVLQEMQETTNGAMDPGRLIEIFQTHHN